MAIYQLPSSPGQCRVVIAMGGNPLVINDKTGRNRISIPCQTQQQAEEICDRINAGDHNGTIHA